MANGLMDNKLFLQYLAAAGQDIGSGGPIGTNVNAVTMQNIQSQNYINLMRKLLAGGASGEASVDSGTSGMPAIGSKSALDYSPNLTPMTMTALGQVPTQPQASAPVPQDPMNIFSNADLAGLSPEMISNALQFRFNIGQSQIDNMYKQALTDEIYARLANMGQGSPIFVSDIPGYGDMTLEEYKALPTEDRQYYTHVLSARQRKEEPMSREEFDAIKDKNKHPASAEAAAIDQLYLEFKGRPPESEIKRIHDLFKPDKEPSPVTWTTATNELIKRFGKLDPTGMWAVTPDLQARHILSQKILVELKDTGYEPLRAVNMSEAYSNKYYDTVDDIYEESKKLKKEPDRRRYVLEQLKTINNIFKNQIGFDPGE